MLALNNAALVSTKFNKEDGDSLYRWAKRRAGSLASCESLDRKKNAAGQRIL